MIVTIMNMNILHFTMATSSKGEKQAIAYIILFIIVKLNQLVNEVIYHYSLNQ